MPFTVLLAVAMKVVQTASATPATSPPPIPIERVLVPLGIAVALAAVLERVIEFLKNVSAAVRVRGVGREIPPRAAAFATLEQLKQHVEQIKPCEAALDIEAAFDEHENSLNEKKRQLLAQLVEFEQQEPDAKEQLLHEAHSQVTSRIADLEIEIDQLRAERRAKTEFDTRETPCTADTIYVAPATDPDDGRTARAFAIQMLAFAAGIAIAHFARLRLFDALLGPYLSGQDFQPIEPWLDYVLTGLVIGGGSAPLHLLIRFIQERGVEIRAGQPAPRSSVQPASAATSERTVTLGISAAVPSEDSPQIGAPSLPDVATEPAVAGTWKPISYDGGYEHELLESRRKRPGDPELIVFHHTQMHSRSTFLDVINVIKNRVDPKSGQKWVTGYHCVVLADGSINPFCRWDRPGIHCENHNARSLGITLNGNFESDPTVFGNNARGNYGNKTPPLAQLDSAARVVALWCHVYGIVPNKGSIRPHRELKATSCPGSSFPEIEFRRLVSFYYEDWRTDAIAGREIEAFKRRPYLYTDAARMLAVADPGAVASGGGAGTTLTPA